MSISNTLRLFNLKKILISHKIQKFNKRRIFFFILIIFIFLAFLNHQVVATGPSTETLNTLFLNKQEALTTPNNQESWMSEAASSNTMILINSFIGKIDSNVLENTEETEGEKQINWVPGGIIGLTNQSISFLYHPPISGVQYLAQAASNFIGKPIYAASNGGYQGLSSLIPLWKGFRDVTYVIFSLIFIIIGIMIMLRIKISQQAVITIQSALPKLITSLILVTFSYAIVGLLIDLSYVVEALGISIILKASGDTQSVSDIISSPDILKRLMNLVPVMGITTIGVITGTALTIISILTAIPGIGFIAVTIVFSALIIIIFWYNIRFFFGLLKCYVNILIKTITGPLEIALGSIPNMKMGFGSWFVDILANLLVFPISMIFLVMVKSIMNAVQNGNDMWTPTGLELFSGGKILSIVIGFCSLVIVSKLPTMIPEFIFNIKLSPWSKAIGEGLQPYSKNTSKVIDYSKDYYHSTYADGTGKNPVASLHPVGQFLWRLIDSQKKSR